jgi:hypothetical protein
MTSALELYARSQFDTLRQDGESGEWWSARTLMPVFGYTSWPAFARCIDRAKLACAAQGPHALAGNFTDTRVMNASRHKVADCRLTRYGAYLIAMQANPDKLEVDTARAYFAGAEPENSGFSEQLRPLYQSLLELQRIEDEQGAQRTELGIAGQQMARSTQVITAIAARVQAAYTQAEAAWAVITARKDDLLALAGPASTGQAPEQEGTIYTGREAAAVCGMGLIMFYEKLRERKILYLDEQASGHRMSREYVDAGWGSASLQPLRNNPGTSVYMPSFTAKGIAEIRERLVVS